MSRDSSPKPEPCACQQADRSAGRILRYILMLAWIGLTGCASPEPFPGLPRLSVTTQFNLQNLCDVGVSPRIALSQVPDATSRYVVQIMDINVLIQTPWRETIPASSKSEIPEGAAKTYEGPCLGDITRFAPVAPYGYLHRVEVLAEDAAGQPLAYGTTTVYVESAYVAAKRLRLGLQQPAASTVSPAVNPYAFQGGQFGGAPNMGFPANPSLMNPSPYQ